MKKHSGTTIGELAMGRVGTFLFAVLPVASVSAAETQWESIAFDAANFDVSQASEASFGKRGGRDVLCLNGEAFARGVSLKDGSVAVDVANDRHRHFANVIFRAASRSDYETAYLRMHKSGQADAVQYTPHLNGETNWQLFREAQGRVVFGDEPWITLRVDFVGDRARIRVGPENATPVFDTRLTLPATESGIGLRTLFEGCFSNFRYSSQQIGFDGDAEPVSAAAPENAIMRWSLSPAFPLSAWEGLSAKLPDAHNWSTVDAEPSGRLLISRYRRKASAGGFERNDLDGVYAAVALHSKEAQTAMFQIDASDMATVWLNGSALFAFDNSFRAKGPLHRGDFDVTKQTLGLNLRPGRNELVVLVAERANGWGLAGAVTGEKGLRVKPLEVE